MILWKEDRPEYVPYGTARITYKFAWLPMSVLTRERVGSGVESRRLRAVVWLETVVKIEYYVRNPLLYGSGPGEGDWEVEDYYKRYDD